uniref:Uncharacterized protein n=1 Tax=Anguilla anguilla TaxID=7936 RepID=A0A0E9SKS4_ANGAN
MELNSFFLKLSTSWGSF